MNANIEQLDFYGGGNEELLNQLMTKYGKKVLKLAYYYIRDKDTAQDIYQDVFIKVYRNLDKFRHESSYSTWLYRITSNLCKDYLKSNTFKKFITMGIFNNISKTADESNRLFEEAEGGEIFSAVMNLPEKYRLPISLYYFDELTVAEISAMLSISESNVKIRLLRGREKLKELLVKEGLYNE